MKNDFNKYLKLVKENKLNEDLTSEANAIHDVLKKYMYQPGSYNIDTIEDVKSFFTDLVYKLHLNFHPDDPFEDYVMEDGRPLFTQQEAAIFETLMNECFNVCDKADVDIYEIGMEILNTYTGLDKLIAADNMYHNDKPKTPGLTMENKDNYKEKYPNVVKTITEIFAQYQGIDLVSISDCHVTDNNISFDARINAQWDLTTKIGLVDVQQI